MDSQITRRYKKCEICGIRRVKNSNVILCNFPLDPDRCRIWVKAAGNQDLVYLPIEKLHELKFICGSHFTRESFNTKGNRLLKNAVPTLKLPQSLGDELFTEFPLHVHSYYNKEGKVQKRTLVDSTNFTMVKAKKTKKQISRKYEKENVNKVESLPSSASTQGSVEYIPIASTSSAPMHTTYENKNVESLPSSASTQGSVEYIPIASTSSAPMHMTYENKNVESLPSSASTQGSVEYIPIASTSSAPMHTTYENKNVESLPSSASTQGSVEYIPIASTSSAPMHMTYENKNDELSKKESTVTVAVQSYKRRKSVSHKHGADDHMTKREKNILKRLQDSKITIKKLSKTSINLDKLESDTLKTIVENALKNQNRKREGKRWDIKSKISALSIFKRSPKAYRYMQSMLPLPSTRTLQRILKDIPMEPGIHFQTLNLLKKKGKELEENEKHCVLLFDEMALKKRLIYNESLDKVEGYVDLGDKMGRENKIAGHVLVFMLQGLKIKFKQPICHFFVEGTIQSEKLAVIIKDIIKTVNAANFSVLATVCDQGPTNIGALNLLKKMDSLSVDENYFKIDNKKVFIVFDVPHLFKSIRNNFFQAGTLQYRGKTAKWSHLQEAEERNKSFLNFQKITPLVVNPTYKIKMRVKYAAHALSNTMKAVLKVMAISWNSDRAKEILETAYVVEEMDKLFDLTNGPASPNDIKKGIRENVSKKSHHIESWNYYLKHMDSVKFLKSDSQLQLRNVRCIKGFKITLESLKDIWNLLSKEADYKYLNLRQLNQDSLENLFGTIRQHSATNKNPTCSHFNAALKSTVISGLKGPHSRGSNCLIDKNKVLVTYKEILKPNYIVDPELQENCLDGCPVLSIPDEQEVENCEKNFDTFEEQPTVYVSGYLAAKVIKKLNCSFCKDSLIEKEPDQADPLYSYITLREWWPDKVSLNYPKKELCVMLSEAKIIYETDIAPDLHKKNIGQWCSLQLSTKLNMDWFRCAAHADIVKEYLFTFISKLFIRKSCKIINCSFVNSENDIADKVKKAQQANKDK